MIEIDITDSELFDNLLEISYGESSSYDIHNDYNLKLISHEKINNFLVFKFIGIDKKSLLYIIFEDVEILEFSIVVDIENILTMDNFHRGRFEYEEKLYDEFNNKKCFYIEFYGEGKFELLCSKAIFKVDTYNKVIDLK